MRVLVLGGAISGIAAARLAAARGEDVVIYDERPIAEAECEVRTGDWNPSLLGGIDLVVTSPGFPEHSGPVADVLAAKVPLISEMEYAAATIDVPYAAVTGTNGKTTVTSVAAEMLQGSGIDAVAAGNIGNALSDLASAPPSVLVIEASSFQLRFINEFHPTAAAILNIAPDHLDWHRTMDEYVAAKQRVFENQKPDDILVFDADDAAASAAVQPATAKLIPVSGARLPDGGSGVSGDEIVISGETYPRPQLDRAYTMDVIAAGELAAHLGAEPAAIGKAVAGFTPGLHRRSVVGTWRAVTWVDDSKATNPHAAVASAAAYPSVVLIAGGRNKGLDLAPIVAVPTVQTVIGIGEASSELEQASDPSRFHAAGSLAEAVRIAAGVARPGDTVLLAPGCASFDMFQSYAARGDEFRRLVLAQMGEKDGN